MRIKTIIPGVLFPILILLSTTAASGAGGLKPLSLSESIDLALKHSVLIHAAREGVHAAEAEKNEAFTGFLPKLGTAYSYTRLNENPTVTSPGSSVTLPAPVGAVTIPSNTYQAGTKDNYTWSIEARQPLFAGGGILANYEANQKEVDIARLDETSTVQDLIQEVKIAYFNILKAERNLNVARQSVELLKAHRDTARAFYDAGLIPKNDLLYAEVELANGQQALVRAENGIDMAKSKFNTVLRREINTPVEIEDVLSDRPFEMSLDECVATALKNRPELQSCALRLEQAKTLVNLARSEYYPSVSLIGNYARYGDSPDVAGSSYKDRESWYVMAVANWNFWEWGKTKNRVEAGLSRENQAADILANVTDRIALEVKNAFLQLHEARKQVQTLKTAIEQAEENFRINTERYREQVGTATDVIDAQTLLTKVRSDHDNALGDYNIGRARIERAMGIAGQHVSQ